MTASPTAATGNDDSVFAVEVTEVAVATAESSAGEVDEVITSTLQLLREKLGMEVAFVSGEPQSEPLPELPSQPAPLAEAPESAPEGRAWKRRMTDGLPKELGAAISALDGGHPRRRASDPRSAPVIGKEGQRYGTLLCFPREEGRSLSDQDGRSVRYAAKLIADRLDARVLAPAEEVAPVPSLTTLDWHLLPVERHRLAPR